MRVNAPSLVGMQSTTGESVQSITRDNREYLVFPMIIAREMVLEYPENGTSELLPAEHLRESVNFWSGVPLVYVHPNGGSSSANTPGAYTSDVVGKVFNPQMADSETLRAQGWVDVAKANAIGGLASEVVSMLKGGETLAVSAGYATRDDQMQSGTHEGDSYNLIQGRIIPDHVAIFPPNQFRARCSIEDGCAAPKANYTMSTFVTNDERQRAIESIQHHYEVNEETLNEEFDDEQLLLLARKEGYRGPSCDCAEAVCECLVSPDSSVAQPRTNSIPGVNTAPGSNRQGGDATEAGGATAPGGAEVRIPGVSGSSGTRSDWEDDTTVNMAGVPGEVDRDPERTNAQEVNDYPGGGRKAWERRKMGVEDDQKTNAEEWEEYPAGTREAYEQRADTDYPLLRARKNAEREEQAKQRERRADARKRNHYRT